MVKAGRRSVTGPPIIIFTDGELVFGCRSEQVSQPCMTVPHVALTSQGPMSGTTNTW